MEKKKEKTAGGKIAGSEVEKFWQVLVDIYFQFFKTHFRDQDGFALSPDWSPAKRGMEAKGLKGIIKTLRELSEQKNIEWTEQQAKNDFWIFLEKAYNNPFLKKSFLCCLLNKYKIEVLSSENNSNLVRLITNLWYTEFPEYVRNEEKDRQGAEIMIGFLKQQYLLNGVIFSEKSVLSTVRVIANHVKTEDFWITKPLKSVSNNLQEFITKIKSKNGADKAFTREGLASEFNRRYPNRRSV